MFPSKFSSVSWFLCFFQPRLFYFYQACVCVFVPGFHHTAGSLWLLAWIPCCSACGSVFLMGLPLHGKVDGSTFVRMAGSEEGSIWGADIRTSSLGFPWAVYSNPLEEHSKAFCSFPFTLYHYLHFLCSRHCRKPFIYLRLPVPILYAYGLVFIFPLYYPFIGPWEGGEAEERKCA